MALQNVDLTVARNNCPIATREPIPRQILDLIRASESRAERFIELNPSGKTGFVPSDPAVVFETLRTLVESDLLRGRAFCEWGSGIGTITCMAGFLGMDAVGIEIDSELVGTARRLANDFQLPVEFVQGSFVPSGERAISEEAFDDNIGRYPWLLNQAKSAYRIIGRDLDNFDAVFVYPWPGEEYFVEQLFQVGAANDAVLLVYHDDATISVRRKADIG